MPSEKVTGGAFGFRPLVPGGGGGAQRSGCTAAREGVSSILSGKVTGSLPPGFARPMRRSAVAQPPSCPGYHISRMARTLSFQGMVTGPPPPPGTSGLNPNAPPVTFSEGIAVGYRWYDQENIQPLFPFGYGFSFPLFPYLYQ